MNKGIITKIEISTLRGTITKRVYIKLDRTIIINENEYNIFIDAKNKDAILKLVNISIDSQGLPVELGKKYSFEFDPKYTAITSITYEK